MKALRWVIIGLVLFIFPVALFAQDPQDTDPKDYYDEQETGELLDKGINWEELSGSLLDGGGASLLEFVSKTLEAALKASSTFTEQYMPGDEVTRMPDDIEGEDGSDIMADAEATKASTMAKADVAAKAQAPTTPEFDPDDYGTTGDNYGKNESDSAQSTADDANANAGQTAAGSAQSAAFKAGANAGKNVKDSATILTANAVADAESFDPSLLEVPGAVPDIEPDKPGNANADKGKSDGTPKSDTVIISGIEFGTISTGRGDDKITVTDEGSVIAVAFDPHPQITGINGEEDDDTITNNGTITVTAISLGNNLKNPPVNGSDNDNSSNNDLEEKKGALAIGIGGGEGSDTINNTGTITATAVSSALDFAVGATDLKVDVGASDAITDAIGVDGGSGDNVLTNSDDITATATSTALKAELTANVGLSASDDAATAIATSVGMQAGDGNDTLTNDGNITAVSTAYVGAEVLSGSGGVNGIVPRFSPASAHTAEAYSTGFNAGDGDNTVNNTGNITAVSTAVSDVITLDIRANGAAKAISTSNAKTEATALITGDGNDKITNSGAVTAVATSVAHAQSAAVSKSGSAPLSKSSWGGEAYAESLATGLQTGAGIDTITNSGNISAVATSVAATESAAVSAKGPATVDSTSRTKALTTGINSGRDDDIITNTGKISAVSSATAHTIEFAFTDEGSASSAKNWFEKTIHQGGPKSEAVAVGITADGVEGTTVKETDLRILPHEIVATASYSKLGATGNDTITNENTIAAVATAVSTAGAGAISLNGAASSDAISSATSSAKGVDAGAGNDTINNTGDITAVSTATAASVAFSYAGSKKGEVSVNATANADAMGLSADGIPSSSILATGLVVNEGGITSTSSYEMIAATGNDTINNSGDITAVATATSVSGAVSVVVKEANSVSAKATAGSKALGLDAGGGDDTITNTGAITAVSTATAGALEISYSKDKDASTTKNWLKQAVLKGGTAADAEAIGIRADGTEASTKTEAALYIDFDSIDETFHHETMASSGDDTITNDGAVTAVATATSGMTSVAISAEGASSSDATSKANARAEGIKAGGGADTITNKGDITAVSTATAIALEATFSKGNADATRGIVTKQVVECGAISESEAVGLKGDGEDASHIVDQALSISADSINSSFRYENAASSGADNITNDGNITAVSTATSGSASLAVSIEGAAKADAKADAKSTAMGVNLGAGNDTLTNNGNITAVSTATALGVGISYAGGKPDDKPDTKPLDAKGGSASVNTSAVANATGISADGILAGSVTEASLDTEFSIDITDEGVDGTLDSLDARFSHKGVSATGNDTIISNGDVTAVATAVSGSAAIGVSIKGANEAAATSTATASALGIDAGNGDDTIKSTGNVTAVSTATAAALEVSFSKDKNADTSKNWIKQAFANNGVTAESEAIGIRADGTASSSATEATLSLSSEGIQQDFHHETMASSGNDTITNDGAVTAVSTAVAGEASVAVSIDGASQADATATALSRTEGIKAGGGDDTITSTGPITAVSTATAVALEATYGKGKADSSRGVVTKLIVEYGAKAESEAVGINGDGENNSYIFDESLAIKDDSINTSLRFENAASSGIDNITNDGDITAVSTAVSGSASVAVSIENAASADAKSQAMSTAMGVNLGAGDDTLKNNGNITAVSTTTALGVGISYAGGKPDDKPDTKPLDAKGGSANVSTSAIANATGISADGMQSGSITEASLDTQFSLDITEESVDGTLDSLDARFSHEDIAAAGNDTITNNGAVTSVATAVSGSAGIGVSIKGANEAAATSTATASAMGIDAGTGDDKVINTGAVTAVSTATAAALEVSFSKDKNADTNKLWLKQAFANNGVVAESEAIGIRGDGTESSSLTEANFHIGYDGIRESFHHETMASSGVDNIDNSGSVTAVSTAVAGEASVAVSIEGASQADATATALSRAEGINAGGGDDIILNTGDVTAVSTATAIALEASFSKAKDADLTRGIITKQFVEYGAKAESEAVGIKGDGEDASHIVDQNLLIGTEQIHADVSYEYAASSGIDEITNSGAVTAVSTALSGAASIGVSINGAGKADAKSEAKSIATGIDAGAGNDVIRNINNITDDRTADITAVSTATAVGVGVSYAGGKADDTPGTKPLAAKGGSVNVSTSAEAEATGISGDGLLAGNKTEGSVDLSFEALDVSFSNAYTAATGHDTIDNNGNVTAVATAVSGSAGIGVSIAGANEAAATSTAKAIATGIDAGTGDDIITNTGNVTAVSTAVAAALEFSFSKEKDADTTKQWIKQAFSNNGVVAEAESIGIRGDGTEASHFTDAALHVDYDQISENFHHESVASTGNDTIINNGAVTSVATAVGGEVSAAVSLAGTAKADATSKATSLAEGIRAGSGDDTVTNTGDVTAVSTATALSLEGTFSKGKVADSTRSWLSKQIVEYGATAQSEAVGIKGDGDDASHIIDQSLLIEAGSVQVGAGYEYAMSSGNDTITNEGDVVAVSTAVSGGGSGALAIEGAASADAKSRANSIATGVDAGAGDDTITNSGEITAVSTATALALGVSLADSKGSAAYADAGAVAESTGITADGNLMGASADASLYVDLDGLSMAGSLQVTNASGDDIITNSGSVTAVSTAVSGAESVAIDFSGASSANMSSSAKALSTGIDAGAGSDIVSNTGDVTAVSTAVAGAFSAGVSGKGNSAWNDFKSLFVGGTNAQATATGITGDGSGKDFSTASTLDIDFNELDVKLINETSYVMAGADDTITNNGQVTATAISVSPVIDAAIAIDGKATAVSTAKASSDATGIDGGTGNDTINNSGDVVATAVSTAEAVVVSISKSGAFVADTIWDGGTEATAKAVGIKGDGEGSDFNSSGLIDITDEAVIVSADLSSTAVTGDDTINNDGAVTATAVSVVPSLGVAVSVEGTGAAVSTAAAHAKAVGIDAGAGNDSVINTGDITSTAVSTAVAMNVAVSKGLALSGDSLWNGGTTATSEAIGIRGDGEGRNFSMSGDIVVADGDVLIEGALSSTAATGEDTINNSGAVVATSVATAPALAVAVSIDGMSAAVSTSEADARAVGIDAGAGNDTINNSGEVVATSVATAASANISVSKGSALAGSSLWDGATKATSEAIGITGDGEGQNLTMSGFVGVVDGDVMIGASLSSEIAGGDDTINNDGDVVATSVATVPSLGVAVSIDGVSGAVSKAEVNSRALGIDAGVGNDAVKNTGDVVSTSIATAVDLNVAVSKGIAMAGNGLWDGATTAISEAIGISGDGDGQNLNAEGGIAVVGGNVQLSAELSSTVVSGDDDIHNTGAVVATSVATAPSVAVAVSVDGGSAALSTATADSLAVGIDAGAGNDKVFNSGAIVATADSTAATGNVSVSKGLAVSGGGLWDGGASATSEAIGISGDGKGSDLYAAGKIVVMDGDVFFDTELSSTVAGGKDDITNEGAIVATSVAVAPTLDVAVAIQGAAMAASKSTANALSVGIDAGTDDDTVLNTGKIVSTAIANADAISVAVTPSGVTAAGGAIWDGGITATSEAIGISGDGKDTDLNATGSIAVTEDKVSLSTYLASSVVSGNDAITNNGQIVATSVAASPSVGVSVAVSGVATALSTAEANATAVGIDGGSGDDIINNIFYEDIIDENEDNTPKIVSTAVASADAISVSVTGAGVALAGDSIWDGGTTATSEAIGISGDGKGADLYATGSIEVEGGNVLIGGETSSTTVTGNDYIGNEGDIVATSVASALSAGVAVAVEGVAVSASTATAESRSAAIDAGSGDDTIYNSGALVSTSVANANAVSVSVTPAGVAGAAPATFDGGTTARSRAIGISGDGDGQDLYASGNIEVVDDEVRIDTLLSSTAVSGDDTIINDGTVVATSVALTPSVGVSVAVAGVAGAISTSTAEANAVAIDAGSGNDTVENSGDLVSTSVANADAVSVSVTPAGVALAAGTFWNGGTTAKSESIGISGDGVGTDFNAEGHIEVTDDIIDIGTCLSVTESGGNDRITNTGKITATSVAAAISVDVPVAVVGLAGAVTAATAESSATAIDAGTGDDFIDNDGTLVSTSVATAITVPVAVAPGGVAIAANAFWDGGSTAKSEAIGISGDGKGTESVAAGRVVITEDGVSTGIELTQKMVGGDDTINNSGDIVVTSVAEVPSVSVAVAVVGASAALSTATAESYAAAIDGGSGNDTIINSGELVATSVANANSVNVAVTPGGVALAGNSIWNGGTTAKSEAFGIRGDGEGQDYSINGNIDVAGGDVFIGNTMAGMAAGGNDTIANDNKIVATSVAVAPSVSVSVAVIGASASISTATAESRAIAIEAGAGSDIINNSGELVATSVANADAVNVAVTPAGVAVASDAFWNGGTAARSQAIGINGDGEGLNESVESFVEIADDKISMGSILTSEAANGNDTITNDGKITATSVAVAPSIDVAVAVLGVAGAVSSATAEAEAIAINAGAGDDTVTNHGELLATSVSNADAIAVSFALGGVAGSANGFFDGGVTAISHATGITGDGIGQNETIATLVEVENEDDVRMTALISSEAAGGNDTINNDGKITATSVAVAPAITETVTLAGVAAVVSTATAEATAVAIDAGAGDDDVRNSGELVASSVATAVAFNSSAALLGVSGAADAVWNGGTTATAKTVGISGDSMNKDETILSITEVINGDITMDTILSKEAAGGNDSILNDGKVTATSVVVAPSISQSISVIGVAAAMATATADSMAIAIDAGAGDDIVINNGELTATSVANADAISFSVTGIGASVAADAVWDGGTTARADAIGISGDGIGSNETTEAIAEHTNNKVRLSLTSETEAVSGNDSITNTNTITTTSVAVTPSIGISANAIGISAAMSTSTAEANSTAIDAGDGDDSVNNSGKLTAESVSVSSAVSATVSLVGISGAGTSAWDGGTTAKANAVGIKGDSLAKESTTRAIVIEGGEIALAEKTVRESTGGNDTIINSGDIEAKATAVTVSANVALSGIGVSAAVSTSTADANATAIDAGAGDDVVENTGNLLAESDAVAVSVGVGANLIGVSGASGAVWDGGTTAKSTAIGISGDGFGEKETSISGILVADGDVDIEDEVTETELVGGNDIINNSATIRAYSTAVAPEVNVAATIIGVAAALSTSTADSYAVAIEAGAGDDNVTNTGILISDASSTAVAVGVSVSGVGVAGSLDAVWEGGTTAKANTVGIDGGAGADEIANDALISAHSKAEAVSTNVAVGIIGATAAFSAAIADADTTAIYGGDGEDIIKNKNSLISKAESDATGVSVSVELVGYATVDTSTTADAQSIGIDGGAGNDAICNSGHIWSTADSFAEAAEVTVGIAGAGMTNSPLDGETKAISNAIGIAGGDGDDEIGNGAVITLDSTADVTSAGVAVQIAGYNEADVSTTVEANATGIDGGSGNDTLFNIGTVTTTGVRLGSNEITEVKASAPVTSVTVNIAGASKGDAGSKAYANAVGMAGSEGHDVVANAGTIDLLAKADAPATSVTVQIAGAGSANATSVADAVVSGLSGGDGSDLILNITSIESGEEGADPIETEGVIKVKAVADALVTGVNVTIAGASSGGGTATATADAVGMDGGTGADLLYNEGDVDVDVASTLTSSGDIVAIFGASGADGTINGSLTAAGMRGDDDDDILINMGDINVDADLNANFNSSSWTLAGAGSATVGMTADSALVGLDGGSGDDQIGNEGTLDVTVDIDAYLNNSSWVLAGYAADSGTFSASGSATGINGAAGEDVVINTGDVSVEVDTDLYANGGSKAIFGKSKGGASLSAYSTAVGIDGGDDADVILNIGTIDVDADAYESTSCSTNTFIGVSSSNSSLSAKSLAKGIVGGYGSDIIYNEGTVNVDAGAQLVATGGSSTKIGSSYSSLTALAEATATGFEGGDGNDIILNSSSGSVCVDASVNPSSSNDTSAGGLFVDGVSNANATADTTATVVNLGSGVNTIANRGWLEGTTGGMATATADSDGGSWLGVDVDAKANAYATATGNDVYGIIGGYSTDYITNEGTIQVTSATKADANAYANGQSVVSGDGTSKAYAYANGATAYGIKLSGGHNLIGNTGTMTVTASPNADSYSWSDADGIDAFKQPDSKSVTYAYANSATAVGIWTGSGNDMIYNGSNGNINVYAKPNANAHSYAHYGGDWLGIDSKSYSYAYAHNAKAYGIYAGNGNNTIWNEGNLNVQSLPRAVSDADAYGVGYDGDAIAKSFARANNAYAVGIQTGYGNDEIWNSGSIYVLTAPTVYAYATASPGKSINNGEKTRVATTSYDNRQAIGISTGDGKDIIINTGSISTNIGFSSSISGAGDAIKSGSGNDVVVLSDGSYTRGDVHLDSGNDILNLTGTPTLTAGLAYGGSGTDTAYLYGSGYFNGALLREFEYGLKAGTGTYTVPEMPTLKILEVVEGRLDIDSDYKFSAKGLYVPHINPDGTCGEIGIDGLAKLAGKLKLVIEDGAFMDGTEYDIMTSSGSLMGNFRKTSMPNTPILTFSPEKSGDSFFIDVDVASFTTVADTSVEGSIGKYLDRLTKTSTGELNDIIGEFQRLSKPEFNQAFASVSPEQYSVSSRENANMARKSFGALQDRLNSLRKSAAFAPLLYQENDIGSFASLAGIPQRPVGLWKDSYATNFYEKEPGIVSPLFDTSNFSSFGYDTILGRNLVIGFGQDYSEVKTTSAFTDGDNITNGQRSFAYGSYMFDDLYMDTAFFYGDESYDHQRNIGVGVYEARTASSHDGESFSSYIETGKVLTSGLTVIQPFSSIEYIYNREEGFTEAGGGVLALKVEGVEREQLTSNLGIRTSRMWAVDNWTFIPEISMSWRYHIEPENYSTTASFVSAPGEYFVIEGDRDSIHALGLGASLDIVNFGKFSTMLDFNSELFADDDRYDVEWKMDYNF